MKKIFIVLILIGAVLVNVDFAQAETKLSSTGIVVAKDQGTLTASIISDESPLNICVSAKWVNLTSTPPCIVYMPGQIVVANNSTPNNISVDLAKLKTPDTYTFSVYSPTEKKTALIKDFLWGGAAAPSTAAWQYFGYNSKSKEFATETLCKEDLKQVKSISAGNEKKYLETVTCLQLGTVEHNNKSTTWKSAVDVEVIKQNPFKNDYRLLAPIDDLKGIVPDDAKNPNAECKIGNLGEAHIGCYINILLMIAIGLCGGLAVIMIVVRGVQYMGDESVFGKTEAKHHIMAAILGLLLALGAYALLNTVNPDLVGKNGLTVSQVTIELEEDSNPIVSDAGKNIPQKGSASCPEGFQKVAGTTFIACKSVAAKLKEMVDTAAKAGIMLSGGGFRTNSEQIALRKANCAGDIYTKPSGQCRPPTARPGNSMHESGKAFDLRCDGALINFEGKQNKFTNTPATKKCFDWLKINASKYGFYNLPSENWHWSTNGK